MLELIFSNLNVPSPLPRFVNVGSQRLRTTHCFGTVAQLNPLFRNSDQAGPIVLVLPITSLGVSHALLPVLLSAITSTS